MRKVGKVQDKLEKLAVSDGLNAVNFAEGVVLLLDSTRGLEAQDLRIADKVIEEGRALVVALNKWDTVANGSALYQGIKQALSDGLAQLRGGPIMTGRSEEHTSELQSLMRISYAVFCLNKKNAWAPYAVRSEEQR